jgi:hypothetical protein
MSKSINKYKKLKQKPNKADNKIIRIILISIILLFLGIMIGVISYTLYTANAFHNKIITYNIYNTSAEIVSYNVMGLNGDKDAVKFGKITAGNSGTRFLNISTTTNANVSIYISGDIAQFISVEKNNFILEQNTTELLPINLDVPKDTPPGNYTGEIRIMLSRP